jgi:hypothetical protein
MIGKQRLSATVDADLLEAAEQAAARGKARTMSAWVNDALRLKLEHDRRIDALADYIAQAEADDGPITADEIATVTRAVAARAVVVRGRTRGRSKRARK